MITNPLSIFHTDHCLLCQLLRRDPQQHGLGSWVNPFVLIHIINSVVTSLVTLTKRILSLATGCISNINIVFPRIFSLLSLATGCSVKNVFLSKIVQYFATSLSTGLCCYWSFRKGPANSSD